ncbi:MAG: nicotinamide-nucleotide amidohydrolase family protein [Aquificae bacterium]|nr:nicotinamide-nucleotide amidohydrolase family protein [Aquificota bacterium]
MKKAFIVIVGSEFTLGLKQEKNSLYIAKECVKRGCKPVGITILPDDTYMVQYGIKMAMDKADIVFVVGGLGATQDDITREAVAEAIGVPLVYDREWLNHLKKKGKGKLKKMAQIPYGAVKVENPVGNAVGFIKILDDVNKAIVGLVGVPEEMKPMLKKALDTLGLEERNSPLHIFRTFGETETYIDEVLSDIPNKVINASPKGVDIYILDYNPQRLMEKVETIRKRLGNLIYTEDEREMEEVVGQLLRERGLTLSTAESSTGGLISARVVNVAGSSQYFVGGIVAYANQVKVSVLNVNKLDLEKYGAVSEAVAKQMALGVKSLLKTDIAVSDTGIAGPGGGTEQKPIGLHYIGYADKNGVKVYKQIFKGDRNSIRLSVSQFCLNLVRLGSMKNSL